MNKKIIALLAFLFLINLGFVSSAHYITGIVEDAKDGESANGKIIVLWNDIVGIGSNLTDTIGQDGNSGADNIYMIDCEMLSPSCDVGDVLSLRVINSGDDYILGTRNVTVSGAGYTLADNITLNSIPNSSMIFPENNSILNYSEINFNCSASDLDGNLVNIILYGNWGTGWHLNETKTISGDYSSIIFTKIISDGSYLYSCVATDLLGIENKNKQNFSFMIDTLAPNIDSIEINESYSCGESYVIVNCTVTDELSGIDSVIIQAINPSSTEDYEGIFISGDSYYAEIHVDEVGEWKFKCIVNDSAGNSNYLETEIFYAYTDEIDLVVFSEEIFFLTEHPIENTFSVIEANVTNRGCSASGSFIVSFYEDDLGNEFGNKNISLSGLSSELVNMSWNTKIGPTNFFVFVDSGEDVIEYNESNNIANRTFHVNSWQVFYGNANLSKILGTSNSNNISIWFNESILIGNLFVTTKGSSIDWLSLQAIGKNKDEGDSTDDFSDVDYLLGMSDFNDSVSNIFSNNQIPKNTIDMLIYGKVISSVPVINSTNSSNFLTGILWDSSQDTGDNEFDVIDGEGIVFVSQFNKQKQGLYGIYDYEITIPVKLREYYDSEETEIYFYYELE